MRPSQRRALSAALFTTSSTTHLPSLAQAPQPEQPVPASRPSQRISAETPSASSVRATSDRAV